MLTNKSEVRQNIIDLFEIDKMPEDKQEEMIGKIGGIIFQAVILRVLPMMSEEDLAEYNKMMDENANPEKVFDFLFEKVPNFFGIIAEESENFRKEAGEVLSKI